jgi:hypothetical protein
MLVGVWANQVSGPHSRIKRRKILRKEVNTPNVNPKNEKYVFKK